MMRLYLDLCCFNRPYDDQTQPRIRLETEAKILLQEKVKRFECALVWSSTLDFENANNPYEEHRLAIQQWRPFGLHPRDRGLGHHRESPRTGIARAWPLRCPACRLRDGGRSGPVRHDRRPAAQENVASGGPQGSPARTRSRPVGTLV